MIRVGRREGRFSKIAFEVRDNDVEMKTKSPASPRGSLLSFIKLGSDQCAIAVQAPPQILSVGP